MTPLDEYKTKVKSQVKVLAGTFEEAQEKLSEGDCAKLMESIQDEIYDIVLMYEEEE